MGLHVPHGQSRVGRKLGVNAFVSGVWEWDVDADRVYGNPQLATFFGLTKKEVSHGLPVSAYLDRIERADLDRVRQSLDRCLRTRGEYQAAFRVVGPAERNLFSIARCFRDRELGILRVTGITIETGSPCRAEQDRRTLDPIADHCLAARQLSARVYDPLLTGLLDMTLLHLGQSSDDPLASVN